MAEISRQRAELIAKGHACENCGEYSNKKLTVKPASAANREQFNEVWHAIKVCGVCGLEQELGIDDEGEIVYVS